MNILGLLLLLQLKHLLADYFLQNQYMLRNRRIYGHPGGLLHVAIHVAGTAACFYVFGIGGWLFAGLLIAEAVIHYHLDWSKDNFTQNRELGPTDPLYWYSMGVDQAMHHLTYIGMVWVWLIYQ